MIIEHGTVIPVRPRGQIIDDGAVLVEDGAIVAIGPTNELKRDRAGHDRIDANGGIVLPGLVNAHTHLPETLIRGICDDAPLHEWLTDHIWIYEGHMRGDDASAGAQLGCLELIKSGVTALIDQFYYVREVHEAVAASGQRALLCPSIFDNCPEGGSIEETYDLALKHARQLKNAHPRIQMGIGPHAPYTVPPEMLQRLAEVARKEALPIHVHVSETKREVDDANADWGCSPVAHLETLGILDLDTLAAHCVWVDDRDIALLATHDTPVLHNPTSNLKIGAGVAPVAAMLEAGVNVAVATDGCASNNNLSIIEEMKLAALLQKGTLRQPTAVTIWEAIEMGTINGARAMGLEESIGTLEPQKRADCIIIDTGSPHLHPTHNALSNVIYAANAGDIDTVIVDGEVLMRNREVTALDEQEVIAAAARANDRILDVLREE